MNVLRFALPAAVALFLVLTLVVPILRRPEALALSRAKRPVERVLGAGLVTLVVSIVLWSTLYSAVGPDALGVWPAPPMVAAAGAVCALAALVLVADAQLQMGPSWRIGIDSEPTKLVTSGLFGVVRNPIFSGMILGAFSIALVTPSPWTIAATITASFLIAIQTRLEEEHLEAMHGDAYRHYASRVGRFVPGIGRL